MFYTNRMRKSLTQADQTDRYYLRIYFFTNTTLCILLYAFFITHFLASNNRASFALFFLATLLLIMQYLVIRNYKRQIIYIITTMLIGLHFLSLLYMGENIRSTSLWMLCFPLLSFMLLGRKKGTIMTLLTLTGITAVFFLPHFRIPGASTPYPAVYKYRFIFVYLSISFALFKYEGVISNYRKEMDKKHNEILGAQQTLLHSKEEVEKLLAEKEDLVKEIHHRIKNNMTAIGSILNLQAQDSRHSEVKEELGNASGRLKSMMILYNRLYTGSDKNYNEVAMNLYMSDLIHEILKIYPYKINLTTDFGNFPLPVHMASQIGIIVNELITNVMKYAFTKDRDNLLHVALLKTTDSIQLIIEDNGHNFHSDSGHRGFGLTLVDSLAQLMDGQFTIDSRDNTICRVELNVTEEPEAM